MVQGECGVKTVAVDTKHDAFAAMWVGNVYNFKCKNNIMFFNGKINTVDTIQTHTLNLGIALIDGKTRNLILFLLTTIGNPTLPSHCLFCLVMATVCFLEKSIFDTPKIDI